VAKALMAESATATDAGAAAASTSEEPLPQATPSDAIGCAACGKEAAKKCACLIMNYCSRECQVKDWKAHKKVSAR
jgi:hypothetical protein